MENDYPRLSPAAGEFSVVSEVPVPAAGTEIIERYQVHLIPRLYLIRREDPFRKGGDESALSQKRQSLVHTHNSHTIIPGEPPAMLRTAIRLAYDAFSPGEYKYMPHQSSFGICLHSLKMRTLQWRHLSGSSLDKIFCTASVFERNIFCSPKLFPHPPRFMISTTSPLREHK